MFFFFYNKMMLFEKHILVVDDDERLSHLLKSYLFKKGYLVDSSVNTNIARKKMSCILYDLIILDIMLPDENGLKFATYLRKKSNVPILMLSAMGEVEDRIKGLKTGVDEYVSKPFEPEELLLRIENVLKRENLKKNSSNSIELGDSTFKTDSRLLIFNGKNIKLTSSESRIIIFLYNNLSNSVKREDLAELLDVSFRTVDVIIKRLRFKLREVPNVENLLMTARGIGYKMEI